MDVPNQKVTPCVSKKEIESVLHENYGLTAISIKALNGYEDLNNLVLVEAEHRNSYIQELCPCGYLVKVINAGDSKFPDFLEGQRLAMEHLNSYGIKCQEEIKNVDGDYFSSIIVDKDGDVITYRVSVRSFLPGQLLDNVTLTSSLVYDVGVFTAKMYKAFQSFPKFPFYENFSPLWNYDQFWKVKSVLHTVTDDTRRQVAEKIFEAFDSIVVPRREDLRKGQIHGDINEQNILVEKTSSGVEICGLIDFQDGCYSYFVYDFAIAISYMMMHADNEVPTNEIGGHMLAGYESVFPLIQAEKDALKTLVGARMVMSLVYGAYYNSLDPSNEYLLVTSKVGWKTLLHFWQATEEETWNTWNNIIKSYTD